jgi:hypothetical protein
MDQRREGDKRHVVSDGIYFIKMGKLRQPLLSTLRSWRIRLTEMLIDPGWEFAKDLSIRLSCPQDRWLFELWNVTSVYRGTQTLDFVFDAQFPAFDVGYFRIIARGR